MANPMATTSGSFGLGAAGLGILGSLGLFGGGGTVTNPDDPEANFNYGNATTNAQQETGNGTDLSSSGATTLGMYNQFAPEANQETQNELNYLNTSPFTSTYDQAQLAQGTNGAMNGYSQAKSMLASQLGARGLAGPGGTSSELAGADAGIDAAEAGTLGAAQNNVALQAIAQRGQNLAMANQVAAQHSGSLFSQGSGATEAGGQLLQGAGQLYDTTGNDWLNEGQQQIQDTTNANNAGNSSWAGLAGIGMKALGL